MNDPRYINKSKPTKGISERARRVSFSGESPNEEFVGEIEVMCDREGNMSIHIERSHKAKYGGKKWHTNSTYATISPDAWAHLVSAITTMEKAA